MRILLSCTAVAAAALALAPAALSATSGCINVADPVGDQKIGFNGRTTPAAAAANQDITHLTFTPHQSFDGTDHYLIARLDVPALDKTIAPGTLGMVYRLFYTTDDGVDRIFEADYGTLFGGPSFTLGHFDENGQLTIDGDGIGDWVDGPGGYITANLPVDTLATITAIKWVAATDQLAVIAQSDAVPDFGGLTYKGTKCSPVVDEPDDDS